MLFILLFGLALAITSLVTIGLLLVSIYFQFPLVISILAMFIVIIILILYFLSIRWIDSQGLADWNWRGQYRSEYLEENDEIK